MLKRLTGKMIMCFGIIIILICGVFGVVTYSIAKEIVEKEIESKLQHQMKEIIYEVENYLTAHKKIVQGLSQTIEAIGNNLTREEYIELLMNYPLANEETLGTGVWYEPFKYDKQIRFFGPYTYKNNGSVVYTEEYATEAYNYPSWDWYTMAKGITNDVVWTAPYYDDLSAITMITAAAPFYNKSNEFQGVVTSDMDLKVLQDIIRNIQVGSTGKAHLIDAEGFYIATEDDIKTMKVRITEDDNLSLAEESNVVLSEETGKFEFNIEGAQQYAYFSEISATGWTIVLTISQEEAALSLVNLKRGILLTSLFILVLGVIATVIISNYISKPIMSLSKIIEKFSNYNLTFDNDSQTKKYIKRKDEIGTITRALDTMQKNLIALVKEIGDTSQQVASSSEELTATSQQSAVAADEVAITIEEIAKSANQQAKDTGSGVLKTDQLSKFIEENLRYMDRINESVRQLTVLKDNGMNIIKELKDKTSNSDQAMKGIYQSAMDTNESAERIGEASKIIDGIAKQTNLLALNAAIEAARAGEAGKGFAVVAEEIGKLAKQSTDSVKGIDEMLKKLQNNSKNAVVIMDNVLSIIQEQVASVEVTENKFAGIADEIELVRANVDQSVFSVRTIDNTKNQLMDLMQSLATIAEENAAGTEEASSSVEEQTASLEEIANASDSLAKLAEALQESIMRFKYE